MESLQKAKAELAQKAKSIIEYIDAFADEKSFVQTDAFIRSENEFGAAVGEGVVSGFLTIGNTEVCLFATNPDVLKGSIGALNAKKIVRTVNNAVRTDKPLIGVFDTSGARITEGIECLEGYGEILRAYSVAYGEVPIVTIIKGKNLGISSFVAGMSDLVLCCPDGVSATSSPLVLAAKTGKSEKDIGSAKALAERGIVTNIVKKDELRPTLTKFFDAVYGNVETGDDPNRACKGLKIGCSVKTVIKELFDKNSFLPVREAYAPAVITGFAALGDTSVGVVATDITVNEGRIDSDACVKISEFLNVCENAELPVVFVTDSCGIAQGENDAKLIRDMSDLIYRVNTLDVDTFSLVIGKAIGTAYTALVSPCEYKIAWDGAEIAAIESEAYVRLAYADEIKSAKDKDKAAAKLAASYAEENAKALVLSQKGYFDNVIDPASTRRYLAAALYAHVG